MNDCSISVSLIKVSPINTPMIPIDLSASKSSEELIPDSLMGIIFVLKIYLHMYASILLIFLNPF